MLKFRTIALVAMMMVGSRAVAAADRLDDWRQDLDALSSELSRTHPRFRDCSVASAYSAQAIALRGRLSDLSDEQIEVEIQRLLAFVGDGHTLALPFGMKRGNLLRIPITLWLFDDGLYVTDARERELIGKRILRVGKLPPADLLAALEPFISHDNTQQLRWAFPLYATFTDFLIAAAAVDDRTEVTLTIEGAGVRRLRAEPIDLKYLETKLIAPRSAAAPLYLSHRDIPFWSADLPNGMLYIQVNAINDAPGETLAHFAEALRPRLARSTATVVDLRLNNGGDASKADELLRTLIAADTLGTRLAVLISRMTFSAAQTFAARVDQWTHATFIGEATGSRPNHYGNEHPFKLPNSGLMGTISSGFNQAVSARDNRQAIAPDVEVPLTASDYFAGVDAALATAIAVLQHPR